MTKLFLFTVFSFPLFFIGQNKPKTEPNLIVNQDSILYIKKCIAFIKEVKRKELSDTNFILADNPFSFEYFDCMTGLISDTNIYTKEEVSYIKDKKYRSLTKWTKEFFGNTKLINSDTINAIFKDESKLWRYFNKHIGTSYNTFSVPIFLRNDTYCLFYSDNHCGFECGGGRLTLYKRENNNWTEIKSYCEWIS